jgi:hypothetical protein
MEDALSSIWNEDGTPKRPEPDQGAEHAFADFAINTGANDELYTSYASTRAKILKLTQAGIGDMVHFWNGERCRAALVIEADEVDSDEDITPERKWLLRVFVPGFEGQDVATPHDEDKARTTWHWPEPS